MKKKGFTLVELLVVIAIIALLMGILMPALARVRQIAFRMICGTNLSGIGKAMLIYANDYDDEMPRAGGPGAEWANKIIYDATSAYTAYAQADGTGIGTITSSFFLLVKYAEVTTKSFICKGDSGVSEWEPTDKTRDIITFWDFGTSPLDHCSYSLHQPYTISGVAYPLTTSSDPGMAVAADPNPWLDPEAAEVRTFANFNPAGTKDQKNQGNSITHQDEGQNVLFLDSHVSFENVSNCGINEDVIFTRASTNLTGSVPGGGGTAPASRQDSLLLMDAGSGGSTPKGRSCFTAETPVWVDGKMVEISKVIAGQKIGKADCAMSTSVSIKGLEEHGAGMNPCYVMTLESGNSITIVHSHYFMTVSGEWKKIEELSAGMQLQTMNGQITIKSVEKKAMPFVGGSYNLILNGSEQYFVGQDGVVALDCSKTTWEILEEARK
jgi:prepilin-type N-terminal cleavage/methylation domain-containing protein